MESLLRHHICTLNLKWDADNALKITIQFSFGNRLNGLSPVENIFSEIDSIILARHTQVPTSMYLLSVRNMGNLHNSPINTLPGILVALSVTLSANHLGKLNHKTRLSEMRLQCMETSMIIHKCLTKIRNEKLILCAELHGTFRITPNSHLNGQGCSKCTGRVSYKSQAWLDSLGVSTREFRLHGSRLLVDGYDESTNTVFQFHGDFWHGNPSRFDPEKTNPVTKTTFKELYDKTLKTDSRIRSLGYNLVTIWENDWERR